MLCKARADRAAGMRSRILCWYPLLFDIQIRKLVLALVGTRSASLARIVFASQRVRAKRGRRDIPNAVVRFFDTGHFALETHAREIAERIREFLKSVVSSR